MGSLKHLHAPPTARELLAVLTASVLVLGFVGTSRMASAYSYTTSGYYLSEHDGNNQAYSYHTVQYDDWTCGYGQCSITISAMLQYVNVWYTSESFSCWYQEVYSQYQSYPRSGSRTTDYYSTPWYNWQYSWGGYVSNSGDQKQIVSIGDDSGECSYYGAGGGLSFISGIVRNSNTAYLQQYEW